MNFSFQHPDIFKSKLIRSKENIRFIEYQSKFSEIQQWQIHDTHSRELIFASWE